MNRIDPNFVNIIINELPESNINNKSIWHLDTEFFGQDLERLHRPHGKFACLTATTNGRDVYLLDNEQRCADFLYRIKECVHVWHNAQYDIKQIRAFLDYPDRKNLWDTMLIEQILFRGYYDTFALNDLYRRYCNMYLPKEDRATFSTSTELSDEQMFYACCDVIALHDIYYEQIRQMDEDAQTIWNIEREFLWVLLDAPGWTFDSEKWKEQAIRNQKIADAINESLPFNPRSHTQVKAFFLNQYGLELDSTAEPVLEQLDFKKYPEAEQILDSRHGSNSASKYGLSFLEYVEEDGKIYPSARQIGAETGRESYTNPPIQTIPGTKEKRECFIASEGCVQVVADYSAQEPRISAEITQDENFIETFKKKMDIYIAIGFEVFDEKFEKSDERRDFIKALFLAISYGMSAIGLSKKLGITEEEAEELLNKFFTKFPDVEKYIQAQNAVGEVCSTIYGRKFWLNHYNNQWFRNALNFPIQGSAADCTKLACSRIRKALGYNAIVGIIHDEIVFDIPEDDLERAKKIITDVMVGTAEEMHPSVPSSIGLYIGKDWSVKE